jgi:hypothetical protein
VVQEDDMGGLEPHTPFDNALASRLDRGATQRTRLVDALSPVQFISIGSGMIKRSCSWAVSSDLGLRAGELDH